MINCNSLYGIVDSAGFKYIQTTRPELYNLRKDPDENNNIVHDEPQKAKLLKNRLKEILAKQYPYRKNDSKFQTDQQSTELLRGLGYVGGSVTESTEFNSDKDDPKDFIALFNKVVDMLGLRKKRQDDKAKVLCYEILNQRSGLAAIHAIYGTMLCMEQDFDGALGHYNQAMKNTTEHERDRATFHCNIANILLKQGKIDEAVSHYLASLKINPDYVKSHCDLAIVLTKKGQKQEAIRHFRKALEIFPNYFEAHHHLASILAKQGKTAEAIKHFSEAITLRPDIAQVRVHFADCLGHAGKIKEAIPEYRHALRLNPALPIPANQLAWIFATNREFLDPPEAIKLAEFACEKTDYKYPGFLDSFAAAYASAGRTVEAIETAQKALTLAQSAGRVKLAAHIQERLEMYMVGQF